MSSTLVSIVIPAYNREDLISETLDSILVQSYKDWECLIVDDGSTDNTVEVVNKYVQQDNRIKLYERPSTKLKGANACRNIGLKESQGAYIVFFDSDDLMTENHLEVKFNAIVKYNCDYVITKTQYFNHSNDGINKYYQFDTYSITAFNYITQKINWLTYDICLKAEIAKGICFNEKLQSGQEYNYFSKLILYSTNMVFIDQVVSLRRHHKESIRGSIDNKEKLLSGGFLSKWYTYLDLEKSLDQKTREALIKKCLFYIWF